MNVFFGTTHLETLMDLKVIAEKHNAKLNFGFDSNSNTDINTDLLRREGVKKRVVEFLEESCLIENTNYSCDKVWFEIYEKDTDKYHTMAYIEENIGFMLDKSSIDCELQDKTEYLKQIVSEFIENNQYEEFYSFSNSPTIITGFGNKKQVSDYRCYREGMALKYFADLVCDYFKEPRINRVY